MGHALLLLGLLAICFSNPASAHGSEQNSYDLSSVKVMGSWDVVLRYLRKRDGIFNPLSSLMSITKRRISTPDVNKHKKCGPGIGYCEPGDCCSAGGNCGRGYHYCSSPACQTRWSNGCDAAQRPLGASTLDIPRPLLGNVSYNASGLYDCQIPGTVALTFDDGPFNFTAHLLDVLLSYGAKATFFITGNNLGKGQIDVEESGWPSLIRRMHNEGHQIGAHTWTHQNLSSLNETELENEMHYVEMALRNVLGFIPTYFRPPYSDCNDNCQRMVSRLGYHSILYNLNSHDYEHATPESIQLAKDEFLDDLKHLSFTPSNSKILSIEHDIEYQSSYNLTNYMLDYFELSNFSKSITVGECMGDPPENWYRKAPGAPDPSLLRSYSGSSPMNVTKFWLTLFLIICFAVFI